MLLRGLILYRSLVLNTFAYSLLFRLIQSEVGAAADLFFPIPFVRVCTISDGSEVVLAAAASGQGGADERRVRQGKAGREAERGWLDYNFLFSEDQS
jgi:hypothetical protein